MARTINKLKEKDLDNLPVGQHSDGNNLYFRHRQDGYKGWIYRYKTEGGRPRELGLGSFKVRTLKEARQAAIEVKRLIVRGEAPNLRRILLGKTKKTFSEYAEEFIQTKRFEWRNSKHAAQWESTLKMYAFPIIGDRIPETINTNDILDILKPIWRTKTETAGRVRQRIENVLDFAYFHEGLNISNPARWRGNLEIALPSPNKITPVKHFEAIHYSKLPEVVNKLMTKNYASHLCLRWIVLTACRSSEARFMAWSEIDFDKKIWTIPSGRTKTNQEHRVPLTDECLSILEIMRNRKSLCETDIVFFNAKGAGLSDVAISKALKGASYQSATVHGLRAAFKDFAHEQTNFAHEIIEKCLAHAVGAIEKAYRRTDLLEKRRELMNQWGNFLKKSGVQTGIQL